MTGFLNLLSRWQVILFCFVAMVLVGMSFAPVQDAIGGKLLDMIFTGEAAQARFAELSEAQRDIHFWATVLNDTAYPLAYGGFFAGIAARFGGAERSVAVIPAFLTLATDLAENTVQAIALQGNPDLLAAKSVLTPVKFGFFGLAALTALALSVIALVKWLSRRQRA